MFLKYKPYVISAQSAFLETAIRSMASGRWEPVYPRGPGSRNVKTSSKQFGALVLGVWDVGISIVAILILGQDTA